jgi:hypothetical protein
MTNSNGLQIVQKFFWPKVVTATTTKYHQLIIKSSQSHVNVQDMRAFHFKPIRRKSISTILQEADTQLFSPQGMAKNSSTLQNPPPLIYSRNPLKLLCLV